MMEAVNVGQRGSPAFRWATWALGLLLLVVVALVVFKQLGFVASQQHRTIEELVAHFRSAGLATGPLQEMQDDLGAARRARVEVAGQTVDILVFDMDDVGQAARLDQIRQTGSLRIDGAQQPILVNGNFLLAGYADHPQLSLVTRSFHGFGVAADDAVTPLPTAGGHSLRGYY
jgi:hypothetical protein